MTRRTRLCCMLLAFALLLPVFAAAEPESGAVFTMAGFDGDESTHRWETNAFFSRMQARSGISFTFTQYDDYAKWTEAKNTMFATGELPDVLFKAALQTSELIRYTQSGQIIDLKPLLAEHAPNLWALLTQNPDWLAAITLPNGMIGALPALSTLPTQNAMWINKEWLDKLHLEMPTDAESLRAVLQRFLTDDPNQNGKRDEIPMAFLGTWDLKFLSHAFGAVANDCNVYVDGEGVVHFLPAEDAYAELLVWLRDLYRDELLDSMGFYTADAFRTPTDDNAAATYGVLFGTSPMSLVPYAKSAEYTLLPPLQYDGKQIYRDMGLSATRGTFAITSACADPAALLGWVDTLYSEEGAIEAMAGIEGQDYEVDDDGYWQYLGIDGSMATETLNELSIYDSGNMPWLFPTAFYNRFNDETIRSFGTSLDTLESYVVRPFPNVTLSNEQREELLLLQNRLGLCVDEWTGRFVLGQYELTDETLVEFRAALVENGMEDMLAFWQDLYDGLKP